MVGDCISFFDADIIWCAVFLRAYACAGCEGSAGNVTALDTPVEECPQPFHDGNDGVVTTLLRLAWFTL